MKGHLQHINYYWPVFLERCLTLRCMLIKILGITAAPI